MKRSINNPQRESWLLLLRYTVVHGVLRLGLVYGVLMLLGRYFSFPSCSGWDGFPNELYRFAFDALVFGIGMSLYEWRSNRNRFNTHRDAQ